MQLLVSLADQLAGRGIRAVKAYIYRLFFAAAAVLIGIGCLVAGIAYLASALWRSLAPLLGDMGADIMLGGAYAVLAVLLIAVGFRMAR
jgi:hypothetical protein